MAVKMEEDGGYRDGENLTPIHFVDIRTAFTSLSFVTGILKIRDDDDLYTTVNQKNCATLFLRYLWLQLTDLFFYSFFYHSCQK